MKIKNSISRKVILFFCFFYMCLRENCFGFNNFNKLSECLKKNSPEVKKVEVFIYNNNQLAGLAMAGLFGIIAYQYHKNKNLSMKEKFFLPVGICASGYGISKIMKRLGQQSFLNQQKALALIGSNHPSFAKKQALSIAPKVLNAESNSNNKAAADFEFKTRGAFFQAIIPSKELAFCFVVNAIIVPVLWNKVNFDGKNWLDAIKMSWSGYDGYSTEKKAENFIKELDNHQINKGNDYIDAMYLNYKDGNNVIRMQENNSIRNLTAPLPLIPPAVAGQPQKDRHFIIVEDNGSATFGNHCDNLVLNSFADFQGYHNDVKSKIKQALDINIAALDNEVEVKLFPPAAGGAPQKKYKIVILDECGVEPGGDSAVAFNKKDFPNKDAFLNELKGNVLGGQIMTVDEFKKKIRDYKRNVISAEQDCRLEKDGAIRKNGLIDVIVGGFSWLFGAAFSPYDTVRGSDYAFKNRNVLKKILGARDDYENALNSEKDAKKINFENLCRKNGVVSDNSDDKWLMRMHKLFLKPVVLYCAYKGVSYYFSTKSKSS